MRLTVEKINGVLESLHKVIPPLRDSYLFGDATELEEFVTELMNERDRLEGGPFTLAEAVASGQRLRFIGDGEDSPWLDASFFDTHQSNDYLSAARITACNYELEPEGGE